MNKEAAVEESGVVGAVGREPGPGNDLLTLLKAAVSERLGNARTSGQLDDQDGQLWRPTHRSFVSP